MAYPCSGCWVCDPRGLPSPHTTPQAHKWAIPTVDPDTMPPDGYRRTRVYVSGPITKGDQAVNVHNAMEVTSRLMALGYAADCPHFSHFMQTAFPQPYERWMQRDFAFINVVDAVLRIPGESPGGDREVAYALNRGIAVYYSLDSLSAGEPVFREDWDGESAFAYEDYDV